MSDRPPAVVIDDLAEPRHVALAVRSRRRIVEVLRSAGRPVAVGELAAAVGLHVTTARTHLRVLEAAGLVVRTPQLPAGPGRPRHWYAAVTEGGPGQGHRELAELLAGALDTGGEGGRQRAEEAGRRWAERQVPEPAELTWEQAVGGLDELFGRLGFAPRRVDAEPNRFRVALERCPFRDVARAHPEVVCSVHLGLMRGALSRFGFTVIADSALLQPFVAPELCMAEVPGPPAPDRRQRVESLGNE
ncbi:helix-turn-helix transcriptional regulator [Blastococcus saxobsidens]|uniref:Putative transcriptional regulator, ArsR family n=1 Tax=Blastococcus saxobsidens (strain DD2) TaxID=1146883 RepID=H6RU53_BLASD|nr:helix-turn-helix domain-containing protein [Blastococcus saxobsidens]CCG05660.1 Putative transcriptional regulator, ArsR family [Blastococcus saxobsidens DD2]